MKFTVECDTLEEVRAGVTAIRALTEKPDLHRMGVRYDDGNGDWAVKETDYGYKATKTDFTEQVLLEGPKDDD